MQHIAQYIAFFSILFVTIALIGLLIAWGGKCKQCKSFNNWNDVRTNRDDHQPGVVFTEHFTLCKKCGHWVGYGEKRNPDPNNIDTIVSLSTHWLRHPRK